MVGCATSYHKKGTGGWLSSGYGYTNQYLGNDIYLITVEAKGYTNSATLYRHFHKRSKEIFEKTDMTVTRLSGLFHLKNKN